jgi:hypothetical protein
MVKHIKLPSKKPRVVLMAIAFLKNENTAWKILSTIDNQMAGKAFFMRSHLWF